MTTRRSFLTGLLASAAVAPVAAAAERPVYSPLSKPFVPGPCWYEWGMPQNFVLADGEVVEVGRVWADGEEIKADIRRGIEALKANNPLNTLQITRDQWLYARNGRREMKLPT